MTNLTLQIRPDAVAVLTLDQPGSKANILTQEMWSDLEATVDSLGRRSDVRGMVIASGKPGIFIAGADLKLLANAPGPNDPAVRGFIDHGLRVLQKLESLPYPTCAVIDGAALGGGLEVALACDHRVCGSNAKVQLGLPEVKLGLIPGWGGTQRLPRVIGLFEAAEMVVSGRSDGASNAAVSGLVDRTVDSDRLADEAMDVLFGPIASTEKRRKKLAPLPETEFATPPPAVTAPTAAREAVRVMVEGSALPLYDSIHLETEAFMWLAGSGVSKQLIAQFFASRKK